MNEAVKKGVDGQVEDVGLHKRLRQVALLLFLLSTAHVSLQSLRLGQESSASSEQHLSHSVSATAVPASLQHMQEDPAAWMATVTNNT